MIIKIVLKGLFILMLLQVVLLCGQSPPRVLDATNSEIRSIWVLPWSINTVERIDRMIDQAVANGLNEILIEVRYRSDALYTPNRTSDSYSNPEYRSYILSDQLFDPLAYALQQGHHHNLKVHAWVVVFNATPTATHLLENNYIYKNHRDWLTYEQHEGRMRSTESFGYFIDPGIPDAATHVHNVICDIASGYPELDGIQLDYIRYPNTNYGHHPISVTRYNTCKQANPELTWNEWRMLQVTSFVSKLRIELKQINPALILSAAVFPDISEARNQYAQDWHYWLDNNLVDRVYPMLYHTNDDSFQRIMQQISRTTYKNSIVMGVRAWDQDGGTLVPDRSRRINGYSVDNILDRINWLRQAGFLGIALFSYDGLLRGDALSYIGSRAFQDRPDMTIPPQIMSLMQNRNQGIKTQAPEIFLAQGMDRLSVQLIIPEEDRWYLEIYDSNEELLWRNDRYYLSGTNIDIIDALPIGDSWDTGNGPGNLYYFHLYQESGLYKYIIPLRLSDRWQN